nr:TBC1 domain family member 12-like [Vulpes vulpes]
MVGPEDAGACSGRNPKLLPVPALEPVGQDGKMIRATGGFGGGVGAVEPPAEEEEEEETPPQQLLRRYLAAAGGGQLESALCSCPLPAGQPRAPPPPAAPRDHLPPASPPVPAPAAEQGAAGTSARARRSGGLADFFARYSAGCAGARGGLGAGSGPGRRARPGAGGERLEGGLRAGSRRRQDSAVICHRG